MLAKQYDRASAVPAGIGWQLLEQNAFTAVVDARVVRVEHHVGQAYRRDFGLLDHVYVRGRRSDVLAVGCAGCDSDGLSLIGFARRIKLHSRGVELVSLHGAFGRRESGRLDRAAALTLKAGGKGRFVSAVDLGRIRLDGPRRRP